MPNEHHEERRDAMRQLLAESPAENQAALVRALTRLGIAATQSSVSRDLREMGAIKTAQGYELPVAAADGELQVVAVAGLIKGTSPAGANLLVVHTAIGAAQRVALAFDRCGWPEVIGNIGGDDTVFVATHSALAQKKLLARIERSTHAHKQAKT